MDSIYLPVIESEDDYKAFQAIMHHELPTTYKEWLNRHADRVAYYCDTHKVIQVKVNADDFSEYLSARGHGADMNRLYAFTESIGKRCKD